MAPYYLTVIPGGQASAPALKSFDTTSSASQTWIVDIPSGTTITLALKDSTGATAFTDVITVQPNTDSSCLNGGSPPAPNPGNGANSGTPPLVTQAADATSVAGTSVRSGTNLSTPSGRATSISPPTQTVARPTGTAASTPSRPATTNASGAEGRFSFGGFGFAGVLGLVGAIFLYI